MPMMLGAMVTSIGAGQVLAKTGRYKWLVVGGFACVTLGAFLLSRMGVTTSSAKLAVNMVVMGLGLGISMSSFTVIVQNQYPSHRLGEVTGGLQFFRSIGGTVGMAIFGTILNNQFRTAMLQNLPAPLQKLTHGKGAALLDNPQVLLSESARTKIQAAFARFGPQSEKLFAQFMDAVRHSLQMAISDIFVLATIVGVAGLIVVLFLREDPLRRTHAMDPGSGELESEAGPEADAQPEPAA